MKVNWDDDIPNIWENKKWQPNHQPDGDFMEEMLDEIDEMAIFEIFVGDFINNFFGIFEEFNELFLG